MDKLQLKKAYMMNSVKKSRLPSAYQEVEYIESSGSQYIDTGLYCDNGYTLKTKIMATIMKDQSFMGCRLNTYITNISSPYNYKMEWCCINGSSKWQIAYNNSWLASSTTPSINVVYETETYLGEGSQVMKVNNTQVISNSISSQSYLSYLKNVPLRLFCRSGEVNSYTGANCYFTGRAYCVQLLKDNVLVRNFIPCFRKSDNVIGMYELVNNIFYTNQGSGTFTKGENVV